MKNFNRRQWLKTAGLSGAFSVLGGTQALANSGVLMNEVSDNDEVVRLSSNENPFGPSKMVRQAIIDSFDHYCRYPYGYVEELMDMIAKKHNLTPDHVIVTGGSTEGLKSAGLTYGGPDSEIVAATPTYLSLLNYAEQFGTYIHNVSLTKDLVHDLEAMEQRITQRTSMVYICNPNNPTGTIIDGQQLMAFTKSVEKRTLVFVDEAYFDYIEEPNYPSADTLVKAGENVVVARTFSKVFGIAGMRIGYLLARPDIAKRIRKNVMAMTNVPAIAAAKAAMADTSFYTDSIQKNSKAKAIIYAALDDLGLPYIKSHTNFVFFETGRPIEGLIKDMLEHNVRVGRPFPPLTDWCRISTGTMAQTEAFATAIKKVMA